MANDAEHSREGLTARALLLLALCLLALRPKDWRGGRGEDDAPGWIYECPYCGAIYEYDVKPRSPECEYDGTMLKRVRE